MFIGSSSEAIPVAKALCKGLEGREIKPEPWYQKNQFKMSRSYLGSLLEILDRSDLGVFVLSPDDAKRIRKKHVPTPRDNVLFELGLFMGRHGRDRTFMVVQAGVKDLWIPSDLKGIHTAEYAPKSRDLAKALSPVCDGICAQLAAEQTYRWITRWRASSNASIQERLMLGKQPLSNTDASAVHGIRILKSRRGKETFRVSGMQCGAAYWLFYHGDRGQPGGGTVALRDQSDGMLRGYVTAAEGPQGLVTCRENVWVPEPSRIKWDPRWEHTLASASLACMKDQKKAVNLLKSCLKQAKYLDYFDPQRLERRQLPQNERQWDLAVRHFIKRGGQVRYVFPATDQLKLARHKRWGGVKGKYQGRSFTSDLNSGLSAMMFGENPGTIYKAVLYLDTPTALPFIYEIADEALLRGLHGWFDYLYQELVRK